MSHLCVDGGQTKTDVYLVCENGELLDTWSTEPLTTPSRPGATGNLRAVVRGLCGELKRRSAEVPEAACFSLTGYREGDAGVLRAVTEEVTGAMPDLGGVRVVSDYVGNWAAATGGEPGIMVLSGGGSVAYGRNARGESAKVGGWGHLLGDEGSGFWIGLHSIKTALRARAGMTPETNLTEIVMEQLEARDERELLRKIYSGGVSEAEIAGLVPTIALLARDGDEAAARILEDAAAHLVELAVVLLGKLGQLPVVLSGGVWNAPEMVESFRRLLEEAGGPADVSRASRETWEGIFSISKRGIRV